MVNYNKNIYLKFLFKNLPKSVWAYHPTKIKKLKFVRPNLVEFYQNGNTVHHYYFVHAYVGVGDNTLHNLG